MRRLPENLVIQFFLLSSVILAGIPWILAAALTAEIRQYAIDALVDEAVLAAKASLLRDITPADLKIPMRGERYSRFHEFVQSSIVSGRTARVKLWSEGGTVIYSDDPAGVGEKFPLKGNLLKALGGQNSAAEIEIPEDAENVRGRHPGTLMGVYIPIIFPAASDPRGVFEIHRYYGPAAERIKALEGWNFGAIGGGFLFLYGSLVFIVWRGWRKIKGQEEALLQNERELKNLAYYDSLTGLPNRQLFYDRLRQTVALARRRGSQAAVMFLDLDGFKRVNDTLGHNAGDLLLQSVAQRLSGLLRQSDTIARQGGDEFTLILDGISRQENVVHVAQNIMDGFSQPFEVEGHELFFATSIGVSLYPSDGTDVETLLKRADIAMYRAKAEGGNNFKFYDRSMDALTLERLKLENNLRKALERDELVLHYQPQLDLKTGRTIGFEALVRWQHPEAGVIPPSAFISLAEDTGLIVPIGEWVLRTACRQNRLWQEEGLPPMEVTINLSGRQFREKGLVEDIVRVLDETGLSPACLGLEITESIAIRDADYSIATMRSLKEMGVKLSIDDFGRGYSSLTYLRRFPIDKLKIDQSFVQHIPADRENAAITTAILTLAHSLKLETIAEGVEREEQREFLAAHGCRAAQGYLLAPPMPQEMFTKWLQENVRESVGKQAGEAI